jgi:plastocyanin
MHSLLRTRGPILALALLGLAGPAAATNWNVNVGDPNGLTFSPATLNISAGDTVTFINGGGFHNAVSDPGAVTSFRCANGCDGSGGNGAASSTLWSATVTFPTPGTVGYHCEIHGAPGQGMFGTINVTIPVELQSFEID